MFSLKRCTFKASWPFEFLIIYRDIFEGLDLAECLSLTDPLLNRRRKKIFSKLNCAYGPTTWQVSRMSSILPASLLIYYQVMVGTNKMIIADSWWTQSCSTLLSYWTHCSIFIVFLFYLVACLQQNILAIDFHRSYFRNGWKR